MKGINSGKLTRVVVKLIPMLAFDRVCVTRWLTRFTIIFSCFGLAMPAVARDFLHDNTPTIIIYDQEGRPGEWALFLAPKISIFAKFLTDNAHLLAGREDVSLRRTSTGTSGNPEPDCKTSEVEFSFGEAPEVDQLARFAGKLVADGHQAGPGAALSQAVDDLKAIGGGRIIYFGDTLSTCEDDPLWVAENTGDDVQIDVVAIGPINQVHSLSELALSSGGNFFHIGYPGKGGELGGEPPQAELTEGAGEGEMELGDMPPGDLPQKEGETQDSFGIDFSGPLFPGGGSGSSLSQVNTGVEDCPAFDHLSQNLLDYSKGVEKTNDETPLEDPVAIAFILDSSGSMAGRQGGKTKMQIAKDALGTAISGLDNANVIASLSAYGFDTSVKKTALASCPNTAQIVPFGKNQARRIARTANRLTAYGYTPLASSLRNAGASLQSVQASRRFTVLISDGEETCGGDPVAEAAALASAGVEVTTYVVGYDLDAKQKAELEAVANAGGTQFINARDGKSLARELKEIVNVAIEKTERIAPSCENPVQGGLSPLEATVLPPGIYTVGEVLKKGEYRYYAIPTREGERANIRALIQSRQHFATDDGYKENPYAITSMTVQTFHPDGTPTKGVSARDHGIPGTAFDATFVDTTGGGFIFGIGDNYNILSPDSLFEVSIHPFADNDDGDAGSDKAGDDFVTLGTSGRGSGHFGFQDVEDVWRYDPGGKPGFTVSLNLSKGDPRYRISVFDEESGKRIGRGNNKAVSVEAKGPVRILLENRAPTLRSTAAAYDLVVSHD